MCWESVSVTKTNGKIIFVDRCISDLVRELNKHGFKTNSSSCCGHGEDSPGDAHIFIDKDCVEVHEWGYKLKIKETD